MSDSSPFQVRKRARITDIPDAKPIKASENFKKKLVGMTFNVPPEWHKRFKMASIQENMTMHDLLYKCFDAYLSQQRGDKGPM